jgi:hypothetical protein
MADQEYEVEFSQAIRSIIPWLIKLLEDEVSFLRLKAVELIGNLANHGERPVGSVAPQLMHEYKVELREVIASTIPLFRKWLDDEDWIIRWEFVGVIGKIINHGECS